MTLTEKEPVLSPTPSSLMPSIRRPYAGMTIGWVCAPAMAFGIGYWVLLSAGVPAAPALAPGATMMSPLALNATWSPRPTLTPESTQA